MTVFTCKNPTCKELIMALAFTPRDIGDLLSASGYDKVICHKCRAEYYVPRGFRGFDILTAKEFEAKKAKPPHIAAQLTRLRQYADQAGARVLEYGIDVLPEGAPAIDNAGLEYPHLVILADGEMRVCGWRNGQTVMGTTWRR
jgi:hypothetical protein